MRGRKQERIEAIIDHGAAALLAAAVAFALFLLLPHGVAESTRCISAAASAGVAYGLVALGLRRIPARPPKFQVPLFALPALDADDVAELILTDAHRLKNAITQLADELVLTDSDRLPTDQDELLLTEADRLQPQADELVLDDILAELGPNSRVVRLFDPIAMPTPGQLNSRIERHIRAGASQAAPADASEALYEALSELRRSLR